MSIASPRPPCFQPRRPASTLQPSLTGTNPSIREPRTPDTPAPLDPQTHAPVSDRRTPCTHHSKTQPEALAAHRAPRREGRHTDVKAVRREKLHFQARSGEARGQGTGHYSSTLVFLGSRDTGHSGGSAGEGGGGLYRAQEKTAWRDR